MPIGPAPLPDAVATGIDSEFHIGYSTDYIFRGQDNERGFAEEYSQRLYADDLRTAGELTSFGYSLSGGGTWPAAAMSTSSRMSCTLPTAE